MQQDTVQQFVNAYYGGNVGIITELFGGKHSQAFSFEYNNNKYVIRTNISDRGFKKDAYINIACRNTNIPLSRVYEIGLLEEGVHFCISDFIQGETARTQFKNNDFSSFPAQFEIIERIAKLSVNHFNGYGEWEPNGVAIWGSFTDFLCDMYTSDHIHDWTTLRLMPYYEQEFVEYLQRKIDSLLPFMDKEYVLTHGDFGNDNFFMRGNTCSGVIDWNKSFLGNHFLDVGRVVLYCPDRQKSSEAALEFYAKEAYTHYKEQILCGSYFTMLNNYAIAVKNGMESSCKSSRMRIEEVERFFAK